MPRRSATGAIALKYEERMAQCWELRKAGASYSQIATQMGINKGQLSRMVKRKLELLAQQTLEGAEDIRRMELERLDVALLAIWPQVRNGNHGAIDRLIRIQERRAKLLGLDAPARSEISGPGGGSIIDPLVQRILDHPGLQQAAHDLLAHLPLDGDAGSPLGDAGGDGQPPL